MSGLLDPTMAVLTHALDGLSSQQAAISSNLANIDTPGYQPMSVDFETALQSEVAAMSTSPGYAASPSGGPAADVALRRTDPRHFSTAGSGSLDSGATTSGVNESIRNDSNKVDLETEMTALTETQIKYSADSRLISGKYAQLYTVLGGR
jgi:flagellar basal-body rod protein FlgB